MVSIDLASRLQSAFGDVPYNQNISFAQQLYYLAKGSIEGFNSDPTFENVTIRSEKGEQLVFSSMMNISSELVAGVFAPPPMVNFSKGKNIKETTIDGDDDMDDAVVVERRSNKQWSIRIEGILVDMINHQYPSEKIEKLREFFDINESLIVEGKMFDDKKIKNIYFTDVEFSGVQGFEDTIQYSLEAKSIKPIEFYLSEK